MKRLYAFSVCAAFMLTATTMNAQFSGVSLNKTAQVPQTVANFLNTNAGKAYSEQQAASAYAKGSASTKLGGTNMKYETVFTEDFSKWTAGSEGAPDATDIAADSTTLQSYMTTAGGWGGLMAYQAGGVAYLGYDTEHDMGYLMTPGINLANAQGVYRVTMRARTDNPDNETQMLQIWSLNLSPNGLINAQAKEFGPEWTDLEWILSGGKEQTSIMFYGNKGKIYVDDLKVEQVVYPLDTPDDVEAEMADIDQIKATWTAVEGATSYYVYAVNSNDDATVAEATVSDTEAVLNFIPVDGVYYNVYVVAKNGTDESYPGSWWGMFEPDEMGTPVALAATNVSDNGFTANWEKAANAAQYIVAVDQKHVATEDGEEFTFFDDDFSSLDDATEDAVMVAQLSSCDKYFKRGGWNGDLVAGYMGMIALTNLYAAFGYPGCITSPAMNFGAGDGKVKVSGVAMSLVDDAVLSIALTKDGETLSEQTVDVSKSGALIDVELEGGQDDSQLVLSIYDAAESGDYIFLDDLKMSLSMNKGDVIELPYSNYYVSYPATSYDVEMPLSGDDNASYTVQGYYSDEVVSDVSNEITVKTESAIKAVSGKSNAAVSVVGGYLAVSNPSHSPIAVYSIDGSLVASSNGQASTSTFGLAHGAYIVRVAGQSFKVVK